MDHRRLDLDPGLLRPAAHLAGNRKKSLEGLTENPIADEANNDWFVYMLRCGNGALYTGVTTDIPRRVREHADQGRRCARFTRAFAPVELVYSCRVAAKRLAYRIEYAIKQLPREKKIIVVSEKFSPDKLLKYLQIEE